MDAPEDFIGLDGREARPARADATAVSAEAIEEEPDLFLQILANGSDLFGKAP
jgi:hypothetical protein